MRQERISCAGYGGRHEQHGALRPISILAWEIRLQAGTARQYKRSKRRTHQPLIRAAYIRLWTSGHSIAVGGRDVRSNFRTGQAEMRKVTVRFCPLVGNHDTDVGERRSNAGEIKLTDYLGEFLEFSG